MPYALVRVSRTNHFKTPPSNLSAKKKYFRLPVERTGSFHNISLKNTYIHMGL
jgi:hypothetical protein